MIYRSAAGPALALAFATFALAARPALGQVAETSQSAAGSSTNKAGSGPERLKQQVRVTVKTNAPTVGVKTNVTNPKQKSFQWSFSWEGWDGLHTGIAQKTAIKDPKMEFLTIIEGTNAHRVFTLEEVKMSGKIGVKLAIDGAAFLTGKEFTGFDDGVEVRRARIYAKGDCILLLPVSYEFEIGYIPNQFYIENSYLAFRTLPWIGVLKVGQYQAPMGLDSITSSRDVSFMESAAPLTALAPGVNAGFQIGRPFLNQRATWTAGLFTDGAGHDTGEATKDYGRAITRITVLPIYDVDPENPNDATLLHFGLSANVLYSGNGAVRYRSRPESYIAPFVIDTGDITADKALVVGGEAAWVKGPFSLQGEYLHSWVDEKDGHMPGFVGLYGSASWFLTGESRPYDRSQGAFARVIPKRNFDFGHGGWGAWEIAGRFSYTDLDSENIHGGRLTMLMAGVNWYLHSHVKWRFDYGLGHVSGRQPDGNLSIFQTRMEVDF